MRSLEKHAAETVIVAAVNFHPVWGQNNIGRIKDLAENAAKRGAGLVVFPEMALTGYDPDPEQCGDQRMQIRMAETIPGPSTDALKETAAKYGICIVFGLPEKKDGVIYNSVAVVCPDGAIHAYQKIHPFGQENTWCAKGKTPLIVKNPWGSVGIAICYDIYQFPELIRYYAAKGCRVIVNCTAQHGGPVENSNSDALMKYYLTTLSAHVVANEVFVISSNLVGPDKTTCFPGASLILGPAAREDTNSADPVYQIYAGRISDSQEGIMVAAIDLSLAARSLYAPNPVTGTPDFRPELYARLYRELAVGGEGYESKKNAED